MNDVSEKIISGEYDYITGEYIGDPVGYPRTTSKVACNITTPAINCINSICRSRGYNNHKRAKIVEMFIHSKGIPIAPKYFFQCEIIYQLYREEFKNEIDRYKILEEYEKEERDKRVQELLRGR